jgi:prepilin-type processing-associated H-X9-DG protein
LDGDQPLPETEVTNPSDMMAIADGFAGFGNGVIADGQGWLCRRSVVKGVEGSTQSTRRSNNRHQRKTDVVFCDGHAESPSLKSMFEDTYDSGLRRWNRDHSPHRDQL